MEPWQRLDQASPDEARALLLHCCGSTRWVDAMLSGRPFGSTDAMITAASTLWWGLTEADWREAFSHHPKIGDRKATGVAAREQSGAATASAETLEARAGANRKYGERFGYIFIVCASGKSADEMLDMLGARQANDAATEIRIAAEEQRKITALRLQQL